MKTRLAFPTHSGDIARTIRSRIEAGGERAWRFRDFSGLPFTAVAQALSRLTRQGYLRRLGKGLYYRSRPTAFGESLPNPAAIRSLPLEHKGVFPSGASAANLLGFTTQNPAHIEVATDGSSLPRLIVGSDTVIHTRRPAAWRSLSPKDAALLDFLRRRGMATELSAKETVERVLALMREDRRFERLVAIASFEPPRVRAILGAVGQQLGKPKKFLTPLRDSLNPLSRFDFGMLSVLAHAREWQARDR